MVERNTRAQPFSTKSVAVAVREVSYGEPDWIYGKNDGMCANQLSFHAKSQWRHVTVPAYIRAKALPFALISAHSNVGKSV